MESSCQVILDSTNYFQWWSYIVDLLRSKGLIESPQAKKPSQKMKIKQPNGKIGKIKHVG